MAATNEQQFCRACGMSLETVGKLVAQHSGSPAELQNKLAKAELEQALLQKMLSQWAWSMIILGIGVVMLIVNKVFDITIWGSYLASGLIVSGVSIWCSSLYNAMMKGARLRGVKSVKQISLGIDTQSLPTQPIPHELHSVTERTTQLIGVEDSKTNKMMDSDARQ